MPAHIFLQLGLWRDAATSDRAAFDASNAWVARKQLGPAMRNYHALSWLQYELLQRGNYREAWNDDRRARAGGQNERSRCRSSAIFRRCARGSSSKPAAGICWRTSAISPTSTTVRHRGERRAQPNESLAADARPPGARRHGPSPSAKAIFARRSPSWSAKSPRSSRWPPDAPTKLCSILRGGARRELQLPPPLGLPEPVKPAPELLGEVLLEAGRPRKRSTVRTGVAPQSQRSLSVLGLRSRAAATRGRGSSRTSLPRAARQLRRGRHRFAGMDEARRALETPAVMPPSRLRSSVPAAIVVTIVARNGAARRLRSSTAERG